MHITRCWPHAVPIRPGVRPLLLGSQGNFTVRLACALCMMPIALTLATVAIAAASTAVAFA